MLNVHRGRIVVLGYVLAEVPSGSSKKVAPYAAPVYMKDKAHASDSRK